MSISAKFGCVLQTLNDRGKKAEADIGKRLGATARCRLPSAMRILWTRHCTSTNPLTASGA